MNYIVLDLEWNQSPLGKSGEVKSIPFEIIEIGAIKLSENLQILDEFHKLIKPQVYLEMDANVSEIVQISMDELKKGEKFEDAIIAFQNWCGPDVTFCTWGSMDLVELQRNMRHYGFPTLDYRPFFFYDVQKLFAIFFEENKNMRTLSFASEFFHLKEDGNFHSAICDARYTAKIFQKFDLKKAKKYMELDYFNPPKCRADETYVSFKSYAKYISMEFKSKEQLLRAKHVKTTNCCICQQIASKKIDWFSNSTKINYYGVFYCKEHGYLKGKLRVKRSDDQQYFAVKTIKIISKEDAAKLQKQKDTLTAIREKKQG